MVKHYYVYILTNPTYTTLCTGVTNDIERRMYEPNLRHDQPFQTGA